MAAYQQPWPPRTGIGVEHGSEDWVGDGGWQPPAPEPGVRQVGESGGSGQDQLPRGEFLEMRTVQRRGVHPASDAFPFPSSQPSPGGSVVCLAQLDCSTCCARSARIAPRSRLLCRRSPTEWRVGWLLRSTVAHDPVSRWKHADMGRIRSSLQRICGRAAVPATSWGNRSFATSKWIRYGL